MGKLKRLLPGAALVLALGFSSVGLAGTEKQPIRISGPAPGRPAVFHHEASYIMPHLGARRPDSLGRRPPPSP